MPETQPDLSHRALMLLDFWFAPESASKSDRLRDIWFQATPEFDAHSPSTFAPITIARRQEFMGLGETRRRPAWR